MLFFVLSPTKMLCRVHIWKENKGWS